MIYPTIRAVLLTAIGLPLALGVALMQPSLWVVALAWIVFVAGLLLVDAVMGTAARSVTLRLTAPHRVGVGDPWTLDAVVGGTSAPLPQATLALAVDARLVDAGRIVVPLTPRDDDGVLRATIAMQAARRGAAIVGPAWVRWTGPLGLVWKQIRNQDHLTVHVVPSVRSVRDDGMRLFAHDASFGQRAQLLIGEGSEFESLADFRRGMDRRAIDWKQTARHTRLLAKEYRIDRDNRIVLAVDSGRMMSEPVGGVPRVDRAVSAAMLLAYVALKVADRVSLFSFAARPGPLSQMWTSVRDFPAVQSAAASIEYAHEEANFTHALSHLASRLKRRSLIVVFTEFSDSVSAELMIAAARRLVARHAVVFVVMQDEDGARVAETVPETPRDVTRATVAAALLRERQMVLTQLQRAGVDVVEAPYHQIGPKLVEHYLRMKRAGAA